MRTPDQSWDDLDVETASIFESIERERIRELNKLAFENPLIAKCSLIILSYCPI